MSEIPNDLKYSQTHEWVEVAHDGVATVGITDHAQALLGDIVFVETPELDSTVTIEEVCGVIESVKAASDLYAIVSGTVIEVNEELADTPESINNGPYADGWIYRVNLADVSELDQLMSADEYAEFIATEEY
ncbi:MAG TPA: glycine cleavage system protein GcvH [Gammaproteobacteria bacterium]|nr:glycine cleavage system protein GcvH [Gammaproteobacteria bacterium]